MSRWTYPLALGITLAVLAGARGHAVGAEPRRYRTPDELWNASRPLLKPYSGSRAPYDDSRMLFLVDYLGSGDPALRDAAAEILHQLFHYDHHVRASVFDPYLSRGRPLAVRVIALAYSLSDFQPPWEERPAKQATWERNREQWAQALNDIIEQPVTPPYFQTLALAMKLSPELARTELIKPENHPLMVRRVLHVTPVVELKMDMVKIIRLLRRFPLATVVQEAVQWYPVAPNPEARFAFVANSRYIAGGSDAGLAKLAPVLEIAARDWEPEIAKRARLVLPRR